jgi:hypothetical protein
MILAASRSQSVVFPLLLVTLVCCSGRCAAENLFDLNFQSVTDGSQSGFFNISGTCEVVGNSSNCGNTPFIDEIVTDPNTSLSYYHLVLGSVGSGFAQEVYIERNSGWGVCQGGPISASGSGCGFSNTADPLDVLNTLSSGIGTGNPTRVIMRQVMTDTSIATDFTKATFTNKPVISQDLASTDMTSHLVIDMSNSNYATANVPGTITYTVSLTQGGMFEFAADVQNSNVTAGLYTYTAGSGSGGSSGAYTYADGTANTTTVKWEDFWDPALSNPWIDSTNRP